MGIKQLAKRFEFDLQMERYKDANGKLRFRVESRRQLDILHEILYNNLKFDFIYDGHTFKSNSNFIIVIDKNKKTYRFYNPYILSTFDENRFLPSYIRNA